MAVIHGARRRSRKSTFVQVVALRPLLTISDLVRALLRPDPGRPENPPFIGLRIDGVVRELYDVAVIPGRRRPSLIGFRSDEIRRTLSFDAELDAGGLLPN